MDVAHCSGRGRSLYKDGSKSETIELALAILRKIQNQMRPSQLDQESCTRSSSWSYSKMAV